MPELFSKMLCCCGLDGRLMLRISHPFFRFRRPSSPGGFEIQCEPLLPKTWDTAAIAGIAPRSQFCSTQVIISNDTNLEQTDMFFLESGTASYVSSYQGWPDRTFSLLWPVVWDVTIMAKAMMFLNGKALTWSLKCWSLEKQALT